MKVILVPIANRPECSVALSAAFRLAQAHDACVVGCHIRPHRESKIRIGLPALSGAGEAEWVESTRGKDARKTSADAHDFFTELAAEHDVRVITRPSAKPGPSALWSERVGSPGRVIPIVGPVADLLILSRPSGTKDRGKIARVFLMEALLNSSRPVLVFPQKRQKTLGKRILIAWNQSAQAMNSIVAALPMLSQAEAVTIVCVGAEAGLGPKVMQLVNYLKFWGVNADVHRTRDRNVGDELTKAYRESSSDLMVMGAYSRSRLRERVFGGVTEHVLFASKMPVLMHHSS